MGNAYTVIIGGAVADNIQVIGDILAAAAQAEGFSAKVSHQQLDTAGGAMLISKLEIAADSSVEDGEADIVAAFNDQVIDELDAAVGYMSVYIHDGEMDSDKLEIYEEKAAKVFSIPVTKAVAELGTPELFNLVALGTLPHLMEEVLTMYAVENALIEHFADDFAVKPGLEKDSIAAYQTGAHFICSC